MKVEPHVTGSDYVDITKNRTLRQWGISLVLLTSLTIYIAIFWARLAKLLPPPYNEWTFIYEPLIGPWWINNFFLDQPVYIRLEILWYILCFVSSMAIPIIILILRGRKLTDFGIGMLNRLGIRLTSIAIVVSIPFGLWIQIESPYPHRLTTMYVISLFNKIPEHFLILGILTALMLTHRRLPNPAYMAPIEGSTGQKILRWLGLAQPVTIDSDSPILAWFGLNWTSLFAICASGLVFFMIHLGRANPVEVALSLPGGIMVGYITFRTHSIWHAIPAHWTLNLVPMAILHFYKLN
jgi:hypothetical protein